MTATVSLKDRNAYTANASLTLTASRTIRFSFADILGNQHQIVAIWRSLLAQNLHPVAHTFLGRIVSITLNP